MKIKELEELVKDINVISDTDSPVTVFSTRQSFERLEWDNLFAKYAAQNPKWKEVRTFLEENLDHLEARKTKKRQGQFLYEAFGYDSTGRRQGIKFFTVET